MKVWLETWETTPPAGGSICVLIRGQAVYLVEDVARLVASAPLAVRALLVAEWCCRFVGDGTYNEYSCNACSASKMWETPASHDKDCPVDAALSAAGLETQEQRNEARREIER